MYTMIDHKIHNQIDARLEQKADERSEELRPLTSIDEVKTRFDQHVFDRHNTGVAGFSFQIRRLDGSVICGNKWLKDQSLPTPPTENKAARDHIQYLTLPNQGLYRLLTRTVRGFRGTARHSSPRALRTDAARDFVNIPKCWLSQALWRCSPHALADTHLPDVHSNLLIAFLTWQKFRLRISRCRLPWGIRPMS